jgi:hypothetical protein
MPGAVGRTRTAARSRDRNSGENAESRQEGDRGREDAAALLANDATVGA